MNGTGPQIPRRSPWLLRAHAHAVAQFQASHELVIGENRHEDDLLFWMIGMAGGAIYLALQVVERFSPSLGFGLFLLSILPWGLCALCGIIARWRHALAVREDKKVHLVRQQSLTGLPLEQNVSDVQFAERIVQTFEPVDNWPAGEAREMQAKADRLARSATGWGIACRVLLAVGIGWFPLLMWLNALCGR